MSRDETKITSDITVYGATGFVGKYICQYLLASAKANDVPLKLVLAGRNKTKLEQRMASLMLDVDATDGKNNKSTLEILVADSSDLHGLTQMAESTRVVIACAGPFEKYGTNVVAACATTGADYVDITGEFYWVAQMRQQFGAAARKSGARIIPLCGFDSVPTDISLLGAVEALRDARGRDTQVESGKTWTYAAGGMNAGTVHTMLGFPMDPRPMLWNAQGALRPTPHFLKDPLCLSHPTLVRHNPEYTERANSFARAEWWNLLPSFDGILGGGLSLSFMMAPINLKVVHSSAVALNYGPTYTHRERWVPIGFRLTRALGIFSAIPVAIAQWLVWIPLAIVYFPVIGKKLVELLYPPGSGAPDALNQACTCDIYTEVSSKAAAPTREGSVDRAACHLYFEGDASNMVTSQCVCESALALLYNRSELPKRSEDGFGTPAELLGKVLLKRLRENKVRKVVIETAVQKDGPTLNLKLLA